MSPSRRTSLPSPLPRRARSDAARQARGDAILAAASELLAGATFDAVTVAAVAARAGVAKGSVFNYFATKEALGLALAEREYAAFYDSLDRALGQARAPLSVGRLASIFTLALDEHPAFVRLIPIVGPVLEPNVGESEARRYKSALLARMTATGAVIEKAFPGFRPGDGLQFLRFVEVMVAGLSQLAEPAPAVARALAAEELAPLRVDFARDFTNALHHYLTGAVRLQG